MILFPTFFNWHIWEGGEGKKIIKNNDNVDNNMN